MADGGNAVEAEVDDDEPPTMSYPLITVSDLPSSTTAGIYSHSHLLFIPACQRVGVCFKMNYFV